MARTTVRKESQQKSSEQILLEFAESANKLIQEVNNLPDTMEKLKKFLEEEINILNLELKTTQLSFEEQKKQLQEHFIKYQQEVNDSIDTAKRNFTSELYKLELENKKEIDNFKNLKLDAIRKELQRYNLVAVTQEELDIAQDFKNNKDNIINEAVKVAVANTKQLADKNYEQQIVSYKLDEVQFKTTISNLEQRLEDKDNMIKMLNTRISEMTTAQTDNIKAISSQHHNFTIGNSK